MKNLSNEQIATLVYEESNLNQGNFVSAALKLSAKLEIEAHQILAVCRSNLNHAQSLVEALPPQQWPQIRHDLISEEQAYMPVKIFQKDLMLGKMSRAISKTIQFPENTIFAHSLGCTASAAVRNFTYKIDSKYRVESGAPVNIFMVSSQPPSTGKSGVHKMLSDQIGKSFESINIDRAVDAAKIQGQIDELEEMAKKGGGLNESQERRLYELREEQPSLGKINPLISDATPEAIEKAAIRQGGIVNILSAEAESITVPIGGLYSDKGSNMGLVLSLWDNEYVSVERSSRVSYSGYVKGCFSVIAQDPAIDTILQAGQSGRGISERFLIMKEPDMLGQRDRKKTVPMEKAIQETYNAMIDNVIRADETELVIGDEAHEIILDKICEYESEMRADGIFGNNLLRGVIGKADKQICKLACILHISEGWKPGGKRRTVVDLKYIVKAIHIFDQFKDAYVGITENKGIAGDAALVKATAEALYYTKHEAKTKKQKITLANLRSSSPLRRKGSVFETTPDVSKKLRDLVIPTLCSLGVCAFDGHTIYINPNF